MLPRFHAPEAASGATSVVLPPDEARHLSRVLRLGAGAEVTVFDGVGHEFLARVEQASRRGVRVRILAAREPAPEPMVPVTLVQAVLKGDHMDNVVRDAVMMGVAAIQPVSTDYGQVRLSALARGGAVERWRRLAVAAAKQCRRAVLPAIHPARAFGDVVSEAPGEGAMRILLVEPAAVVLGTREVRVLGEQPAPRSAVVGVGSEGGWTPSEVEAALANGWLAVTLGRRTLRADAVPVAAIGILQFCWRDL